MARPKKSTVDYFPHDTSHGSTMQVIESKWGNDGYAFWFKLLELLGGHDNHVIDCRKPAEWEFLAAKTRLDNETVAAILDLLARLEAIDPFLWNKHKVIFCPKFLSRIQDAYRKRLDKLPSLEKVYSALNIVLGEFPAEETPLNEQTDAGSTERERERERESKGESLEAGAVPVKPSRPRAQKMTDEEWTAQIKANPAYEGIDIDRLIGKCQAWCNTHGRQLTRARILNWLNREEKPFKGKVVPINRPVTYADSAELRAQEQRRAFLEG